MQPVWLGLQTTDNIKLDFEVYPELIISAQTRTSISPRHTEHRIDEADLNLPVASVTQLVLDQAILPNPTQFLACIPTLYRKLGFPVIK